MHMPLILLALCLRKPNGISHLFSTAYTFAGNGCNARETEITVKLETAYMTLLTLPYGTTARLGLVRPRFGTLNTVDEDDLPQVDRPDVLRQFFGEGAPFNGIRDRSRRELRVDSGVRGTQHASRRGTPWGVKPVDNGSTSASHTADERATPAIYADAKEPAQASLKKTGASG